MKRQNASSRKARTRTLIQLGGLVQKSGLMDAFLIKEGDDLQEYKNLEKAAQLLGFLSESFEKSTFDEQEGAKWHSLGVRCLKYS